MCRSAMTHTRYIKLQFTCTVFKRQKKEHTNYNLSQHNSPFIRTGSMSAIQVFCINAMLMWLCILLTLASFRSVSLVYVLFVFFSTHREVLQLIHITIRFCMFFPSFVACGLRTACEEKLHVKSSTVKTMAHSSILSLGFAYCIYCILKR